MKKTKIKIDIHRTGIFNSLICDWVAKHNEGIESCLKQKTDIQGIKKMLE